MIANVSFKLNILMAKKFDVRPRIMLDYLFFRVRISRVSM